MQQMDASIALAFATAAGSDTEDRVSAASTDSSSPSILLAACSVGGFGAEANGGATGAAAGAHPFFPFAPLSTTPPLPSLQGGLGAYTFSGFPDGFPPNGFPFSRPSATATTSGGGALLASVHATLDEALRRVRELEDANAALQGELAETKRALAGVQASASRAVLRASAPSYAAATRAPLLQPQNVGGAPLSNPLATIMVTQSFVAR